MSDLNFSDTQMNIDTPYSLINYLENNYNHITFIELINNYNSNVKSVIFKCFKLLDTFYPEFKFLFTNNAYNKYEIKIIDIFSMKYSTVILIDVQEKILEIFIKIIRYVEACKLQNDFHKPVCATDMYNIYKRWELNHD